MKVDEYGTEDIARNALCCVGNNSGVSVRLAVCVREELVHLCYLSVPWLYASHQDQRPRLKINVNTFDDSPYIAMH